MTSPRQSFPSVAGMNPEILILGSMPGEESLRMQQYYAFKYNVFWRIMGDLLDFSPDLPYLERLNRLTQGRISLWDVLASCHREGSLDTAIQHPEPNDITLFIANHPSLQKICCNGGSSFRYFKKFFPEVALPVFQLPSTSPAAAQWSYPEKLARWRAVISDKRA